MSDYDYLFKVIVVGDGAVGKTALTIRFSEGRFQDHYKMTIGVDFAIKMVEIDGRKVKLQIWDTGGQERFSYIRPLYYKGAMGVVYVFDITNRSSFEHLTKWYKEVGDYCGAVPSLLVANKCDLPDRAVTVEEAEQSGSQINAPFFEASAKTGDNVDDLFSTLGRVLIQQEGVITPAPAQAPAPAPASIAGPPAPAPAPIAGPPAPAPAPIAGPPAPAPVAGPTDTSLDEALSFLNNTEEPSAPAPAPVSIPAPQPVAVPEPQPVIIPEPQPVAIPEPQPAPAPFGSQPQFQTPAAPEPAAAPAPFSSFLTPAQPEEPQASGFIPFVPQASTPEAQPVIKPVPASPSAPITLEVAPRTAPAAAPAPAQNSCPNCGKNISARWKFCTFCGTPLQ